MKLFATDMSTATGVLAQIRSGWSGPRGHGASSGLLEASKEDLMSVFETLGTTPEGLTESEVAERFKTYGRNTVAHERATAWPLMLLNNFRNPFILVLFVLGAVSYATGDLRGTAVVSVMVIVSVVMRFLQEYRSSRAAEALRAMVQTTATVTRRYHREGDDAPVSGKREVPFEELVPGDIVHLSAGDMIPADIRLVTSKDLFVSQSALTGEAMPVEKYDTLAVAVGLTPEMLPMVVTANLARGAVAMARRKVIVKRLNAIQNLGAMDVLCTDKTGTLTQDRVILEKHRDIRGDVDLRVLEYAYLNSYHQTGLKNLLDRAVLEHAELQHELGILRHADKVDEIPFDFLRRRMSVVVATRSRERVLICKGAVEEVFAICTLVDVGYQTMPFSDALRDQATRVVWALNEDGFRVVAVAHKTVPVSTDVYTVADEHDLVLAGFIAFLDPPKKTAREAIAALHDHGVAVVVLTGDNDIVTRRVCRDVGIPADRVVLGSEVEGLSDEALRTGARGVSVFAKLNPLQKARIIRALQQDGHTVGYLGDGINDAAALRDADVGISVDTATDIARESADIILLEKSLLVLETGVLKGREVYGNIIKYIKMTASSNFGNVFSVLVASAFIPFLPMLPVQLLVLNLLYDFSQLSLPWDRMDAEFLRRPRKWDTTGIARFMVWIGPISSIFDITTFLLLWFVLQAKGPTGEATFQSGWFIESLLSQTLIIHMIRTEKVPFIQSRAAVPVLLLTSLVMAVGVYLPFSSLGSAVSLVRLPATFFPWLVATLLAYGALTQLVKTWYIRRFHAWL
jgi:Mg2+-importing ATPase